MLGGYQLIDLSKYRLKVTSPNEFIDAELARKFNVDKPIIIQNVVIDDDSQSEIKNIFASKVFTGSGYNIIGYVNDTAYSLPAQCLISVSVVGDFVRIQFVDPTNL